MAEVVEKKLPVCNWKRIDEKKFPTYEEAKEFQAELLETFKNIEAGKVTIDGVPIDMKASEAKVKVFRRYDGTFDVVAYQSIAAAQAAAAKLEKAADEFKEQVQEMAKKHGLKSKDRKKADKKKA